MMGILRGQSDPFVGQIAIPGGFVLEQEDLDQAGLRELKKETGSRMFTSNNFIPSVSQIAIPEPSNHGRILRSHFSGSKANGWQ